MAPDYRAVSATFYTLTNRDTDTGANASAEGGDEEDAEDQAVKVNNIVHSFRLQSTSFDKKGYLAYLKGMTPLPSKPYSKNMRAMESDSTPV